MRDSLAEGQFDHVDPDEPVSDAVSVNSAMRAKQKLILDTISKKREVEGTPGSRLQQRHQNKKMAQVDKMKQAIQAHAEKAIKARKDRKEKQAARQKAKEELLKQPVY